MRRKSQLIAEVPLEVLQALLAELKSLSAEVQAKVKLARLKKRAVKARSPRKVKATVIP